MTKPVRAAIVGFDNPHAMAWLETFKHCPAIGDLVLCGEGAARGEGISAVYATLEEMLAVESLGLALVCTRNDLAPALIHELLAAKIPLIAEKPVARSADEIAAIEASAQKNNVPWATAFMNRCHPAARQMKEWVEEGVIGEITSVEGRMVTSVVAQRNPGHWLFDHDKAGGGILHWLAIHTVDLIRYISGCEYASVCAMTATPLESIDVEEVASATFSLDNGALGQIHAGYLLPRRYGDIYLCMRGTRGDITWKIWGCEGRIDQLLVQSDVGAWADEEYREIHCPAASGPGYGGQMGIDYISDFCAAAAEGTPFISSGEDALRAMQFVEAAYTSAGSGHRVELI